MTRLNTAQGTMNETYDDLAKKGRCLSCGGEIFGLFTDEEVIQAPCPHEAASDEYDWLEPTKPIRKFLVNPAGVMGAFPNSLRDVYDPKHTIIIQHHDLPGHTGWYIHPPVGIGGGGPFSTSEKAKEVAEELAQEAQDLAPEGFKGYHVYIDRE